MRIRPGLMAAVTTAVFVLASCGSDSDGTSGGDEESPESPSASESADESPTESATTTEPTDDGGMTAPGTELKYGETATLQIKGQGVVEITVVRVDPAKPADLSGESIDLAKESAFYIKSRITVVSHGADEITTSSVHGDLVGLTAAGPAGPLPSATLEQCQYPVEPRLPEPGDSFQTCNPIIVPKGKPLQGVQYARTDSPYNLWDGEPLVWRP